jgi:hypothetical protein
MRIEVSERYRVFDKKKEHFWEVRVDGRIVEITKFDPTEDIQKMCEELSKQGAVITTGDEKEPFVAQNK